MFDKTKSFLLAEDRGVSPVIGVILMVAITVILAAVIATFVMNMGPPKDSAPTASWDITNESNGIAISHAGGSGADASELQVIVTYKSGSPGSETFDLVNDIGYSSDTTINASSSFKLYNSSASTSGMGATMTRSTADVEKVEIIWKASQSDKSDTLATWKAN